MFAAQHSASGRRFFTARFRAHSRLAACVRAGGAGLLFLLPLFARAEIVLNGWNVFDDQPMAVLRDTTTRESSPWLTIGQSWRGHTFVGLDPAHSAATFKAGGRTVELFAPLERSEAAPEVLVLVRARVPADFTGKPREELVLSAPGATYRVQWIVGQLVPGLVLQPGREYDFLLVEHRSSAPGFDLVSHEIARLSEAGRVLHDRDVCGVHNAPLTKTERPMPYGHMALGEILRRAGRDAAPTSAREDDPAARRTFPETYTYRECPHCAAAAAPAKQAAPATQNAAPR